MSGVLTCVSMGQKSLDQVSVRVTGRWLLKQPRKQKHRWWVEANFSESQILTSRKKRSGSCKIPKNTHKIKKYKWPITMYSGSKHSTWAHGHWRNHTEIWSVHWTVFTRRPKPKIQSYLHLCSWSTAGHKHTVLSPWQPCVKASMSPVIQSEKHQNVVVTGTTHLIKITYTRYNKLKMSFQNTTEAGVKLPTLP